MSTPNLATRRSRDAPGSAFASHLRVLETLSLSWSELARRTWGEVVDDDVPGLAAQLSYYFYCRHSSWDSGLVNSARRGMSL